MRNKIAIFAAVSAPLILGATGALASQPQFQTPTTDRAQHTQTLLSRAARAVSAGAAQTAEEHVSNLWLFPTAEEDTVFAQYIVTRDQSPPTSEEHLELVRMKGDQIVEQRDLTRATSDSTLRAKQTSSGRDWSASIGTGRAASTTETSPTSQGSPSSPHWSASIGTGHISDDSAQRLPAVAAVAGSQAPQAHWSSKIGTARAADPITSAHTRKSAS